MLEVVEQQKCLARAQMRARACRATARPATLAYTKWSGDRLGNQGGIGDGGQRHPPDAVGKRLQGLRRGLQGEPGLANATRTGQRGEPEPGAVNISRRAPSSASRPMSAVGWAGRLCGCRSRLLSGGNSAGSPGPVS